MTEETRAKSRWVRIFWVVVWFSKWSLVTATMICFSFGVVKVVNTAREWFGAQYAYAMDNIRERFTEVRIIKEVQILDPESTPVEQIIEEVSAANGFNANIIKAIAIQESGKFLATDRVRYESHLLYGYVDKNGKRHGPVVFPPSGLNEIERQLYASSIGVTQVIFGLHARRCGLRSHADLYNAKVAVQCSIAILKANLDACSRIREPLPRLREAIRMYNGSGDDAEQYADQVMRRFESTLHIELGYSDE